MTSVQANGDGFLRRPVELADFGLGPVQNLRHIGQIDVLVFFCRDDGNLFFLLSTELPLNCCPIQFKSLPHQSYFEYLAKISSVITTWRATSQKGLYRKLFKNWVVASVPLRLTRIILN